MNELNIPSNFAVINISSGIRYINNRIHGISKQSFSEVRTCIAQEYKKGELKGIAFGKTIKLEGVSEGKIVDMYSFTNAIIESIETAEQAANERIHKIIYHVSLEGYEQNYINKCIEEALCRANFKKSDITYSNLPVSVQI